MGVAWLIINSNFHTRVFFWEFQKNLHINYVKSYISFISTQFLVQVSAQFFARVLWSRVASTLMLKNHSFLFVISKYVLYLDLCSYRAQESTKFSVLHLLLEGQVHFYAFLVKITTFSRIFNFWSFPALILESYQRFSLFFSCLFQYWKQS